MRTTVAAVITPALKGTVLVVGPVWAVVELDVGTVGSALRVALVALSPHATVEFDHRTRLGVPVGGEPEIPTMVCAIPGVDRVNVPFAVLQSHRPFLKSVSQQKLLAPQ